VILIKLLSLWWLTWLSVSSSVSTPVSIPTISIQLPTYLHLANDLDDAIADVSFPSRTSRASPPVAPLDDLAWYTPPTSTIPAATTYQDLPYPTIVAEGVLAGDGVILPSGLRIPGQSISRNYTSAQAFATHPALAAAATAIEMNKYFGTRATGGFAVCDLTKPIAEADIPANSLKQYNRIFYKQKVDASNNPTKFAARCYTDGSHQDPATFYSTYAGTCDTKDKLAMLAGYVGMANEHHLELDLCDFDVPGAFLQTRLTDTNTPQACYIKFAGDIRHPCANQWFQRFSGTYGARDANNLFDTDFANTCALAEFYPNPEQPKIFTRVHPTNSKLSCSVSMHVDDGLLASTHRPYLVELRRILEDRYGLLTWNDVLESNTGFHFERFSDGSLTVDQHGYELRMLQDLGATALPHVDRASLADFFDPPTDTTPVNQHEYRKIIGCLIHLLPTWHRIRKEIVHLSTRQGSATQSDLTKVIRVLAYINCHRKNYIRFSGSDSQIYLWADA